MHPNSHDSQPAQEVVRRLQSEGADGDDERHAGSLRPASASLRQSRWKPFDAGGSVHPALRGRIASINQHFLFEE